MKIKYSNKTLNIFLKSGLFFTILGIILLVLHFILSGIRNYPLGSFGYGQITMGIFILIIYYFMSKKQYLIIENGFIKKNTLISKKIKLKEIQQIKKFAGDYKLKTDKTEFVINTQIIDKKSLSDLDYELERLNLNWRSLNN